MNQPPYNLRVIISGGGTGGHIFPAIAIANALKQIDQAIDILFVGASGRMEMEKVPAAGYKIVGLNIAGIQRKLTLSNLSWPFKLIESLKKAQTILNDFKPHVAVGVGGYASGPLLYMAARMKTPCLIQEQNSYAGLTNKLLARRVQKICVAYDNMDQYFPAYKILKLGNPVRENILNIEGLKDEAFSFFGVDGNKPVLLVLGGSLGARTINLSIQHGLDQLVASGIQVIWQTGKSFHEVAVEATESFRNQIKVYDFIHRMDLAYSIADLVVSRAGASTVSELCIVKKPCILVPSPNVAEDHQTKNALALVAKNAAILISDTHAPKQLVDEINTVIKDKEVLKQLSNNISALALPGAAKKIAEEVVALAGSTNLK